MTTEFEHELLSRAHAAQLHIDPSLISKLGQYYELLRVWNQKINLTALPLDPVTGGAIARLIIEPLIAARIVAGMGRARPPLAIHHWFDLGSGGGSPAIPIKLQHPAWTLTMVESKSRKAAFLSEAIRILELPQTTVVCARFSELRDRAIADFVSVRAVRLDAEFARVVHALLMPNGVLAAFQSTNEITALPGLEPLATEPLTSEPPSWLHVYRRGGQCSTWNNRG